MNLNINDLYKEMLNAALNVVGDEAQQMSGPLQQALEAQKASIEALAQAKLNGEINEDEFAAELEREKAILEVELITLEIIAKATVQKAINAAMSCLTSALSR